MARIDLERRRLLLAAAGAGALTMGLRAARAQTPRVPAVPPDRLPIPRRVLFGDPERSASGYITAIDVGGVELHGADIRTALDLRSHNLDIAYTDAGFTFTTYGYGHGVGLSQYGADFLARQGLTFDEILHTYYPGVTIKQIDIAAEV